MNAIKKFSTQIGIFVAVFILCALPIFTFLIALYTLKLLVSPKLLLGLPACIAFCITIAILISINRSTKTLHISKLKSWIKNREYKLELTYILFIIACFSIRSEIIFDNTSISNFITIQWMIFTVSTAIFLVYCNSIKQYLQKQIPDSESSANGLARMEHLNKRKDFYTQVGEALSPIKLLEINLLSLIVTTGAVYCAFGLNIYTQAIVVFSFYLSTNSLCMIFQQTAIPAKREIETILKKYEISVEEENSEITKAVVEEIILRLKDKIGDAPKGGDPHA